MINEKLITVSIATNDNTDLMSTDTQQRTFFINHGLKKITYLYETARYLSVNAFLHNLVRDQRKMISYDRIKLNHIVEEEEDIVSYQQVTPAMLKNYMRRTRRTLRRLAQFPECVIENIPRYGYQLSMCCSILDGDWRTPEDIQEFLKSFLKVTYCISD